MIAMDTTALIDFYKNDKNLKNLLDGLDENEFFTSIINHQEVMFGLNPKRKDYEIEKEYYRKFFEAIIVFDYDSKSSTKASEIYWSLSDKGETIGKFDCMIIGNLISNGVDKIITKNKKHFEKIKGLKVFSY